MPRGVGYGSYDELGRALLEEERRKERERNQASVSKMQIEALKRQAQSQGDIEQGFSQASELYNPMLETLQANVAAEQAATASAMRDAATSRMMALSLANEPPVGSGDVYGKDTMSSVVSQYKSLMQLNILAGLERGEYPPQWQLDWAMSGVEHPDVGMRKAMTKELEVQATHQRTMEKDLLSDWFNAMDDLDKAMRSPDLMPEEKELIANQRTQKSNQTISLMQSYGIQPPDILFQSAQRFPEPTVTKGERFEQVPAPEVEVKGGRVRGRRLPYKEGRRVYRGREDIVYGKEPLETTARRMQLSPAEEQFMLRDAYTSAIRETFAGMPEQEIERMADEMMGGVTREVKAPRRGRQPSGVGREFGRRYTPREKVEGVKEDVRKLVEKMKRTGRRIGEPAGIRAKETVEFLRPYGRVGKRISVSS